MDTIEDRYCLQLVWPLEKAMAPHSSTLAWKIPWTEEPDRLQSMGSLRVGHDWATSLSLFTFMHWRGKWQPTHLLAWRIPGTGEPDGLPSLGSHRVGHDWSDLAAAVWPYHYHQNRGILKGDSIDDYTKKTSKHWDCGRKTAISDYLHNPWFYF